MVVSIADEYRTHWSNVGPNRRVCGQRCLAYPTFRLCALVHCSSGPFNLSVGRGKPLPNGDVTDIAKCRALRQGPHIAAALLCSPVKARCAAVHAVVGQRVGAANPACVARGASRARLYIIRAFEPRQVACDATRWWSAPILEAALPVQILSPIGACVARGASRARLYIIRAFEPRQVTRDSTRWWSASPMNIAHTGRVLAPIGACVARGASRARLYIVRAFEPRQVACDATRWWSAPPMNIAHTGRILAPVGACVARGGLARPTLRTRTCLLGTFLFFVGSGKPLPYGNVGDIAKWCTAHSSRIGTGDPTSQLRCSAPQRRRAARRRMPLLGSGLAKSIPPRVRTH